MDEERISDTNASSVANKETNMKSRNWKIDIRKQKKKVLKYNKKLFKTMGNSISILNHMEPEVDMERKKYLLNRYILKGLLKESQVNDLAQKSFSLKGVLCKSVNTLILSINAGTGQKCLLPPREDVSWADQWRVLQSKKRKFQLEQLDASARRQQIITSSEPGGTPGSLTPASQLSNSGVMTMPGLKNVGNSCYINSAIQALWHSKLFVYKIKKTKHNSPLLTTVQTLFEKMENSQGDELNIAFDEFYKTGIDFTVFKKYQQHDCSQFTEYILETLHSAEMDTRSLKIRFKLGPGFATPVYEPTNDSVPTSTTQKPLKKTACIIKTLSIVDYVFGGKLVTKIKCSECKIISYKADMFRILHLAFPMEKKKLSVQTLLNFYFASEHLTNDNMYSCTTCKGLRNATRSVLLKNIPNNLVLTLKRFNFNREVRRLTKQMARVHYDFQITVDNVFTKSVHSYKLFAIIVHRGRSMSSGHYYVIAQNGKDWFIYDDESVSPTSEKEINSLKSPDTPYILFYRKIY